MEKREEICVRGEPGNEQSVGVSWGVCESSWKTHFTGKGRYGFDV